ncbi:MAG: hypothetical protein HDR21_15425 [Lachnospiraceae bacterium]|nr:hypothetical protein [Lachnospiraceae bacterium]
MNKNKKVMIAASSFVIVCLFILCGFSIFSGKKDSSDNVMVESFTFDTDPVTDPDTPHEFHSGDSGVTSYSQDLSNEVDVIIEETITTVPIDDVLEDDSLPSHSFSPGTP